VNKIASSCLLAGLLLLSGCTSLFSEENPTQKTEERASEESTTQQDSNPVKGETIRLASFSDRIFMKNLRKEPIILDNKIINYQDRTLAIYDESTFNLIKEFKIELDTAPVALDNGHLLCVTEGKLMLLALDDFSLKTLAQLDSALFCKPFVFEDKIFIQYVNNFSECFDCEGRSLWKILLPIGSNYYKQTAYAPCFEDHALYVAYPGSPLVKIDANTGRVLWLSKSLTEAKSFVPASFAINQVATPLQVQRHKLFAQTLLGDLVIIDAETGRFLGKQLIAPHSTIQLDEKVAYFISQDLALTAYDLQKQSVLWSIPNMVSDPSAEAHMTHFSGEGNLLVSLPNGHMMLVDCEAGLITQQWSHHYGSCAFLTPSLHATRFYGLSDRGSLIRFHESDFKFHEATLFQDIA